ncbi:STAS-like domain-containing protein [Dyadobacter alkalitolerans]|uniref:STAS-like domain-containing protein n=1 Tax=Dyadobacter alkalitolerans TaxID=492736 RepID=UPI00047A6058|nr:STAS-like domain-containing protein [Dyadobacter alkalitolerans]
MNKLVIFDIIQSNTAAFQEEGERVFNLMADEVASGISFELSFEGIDMCSTLFLNASIGRLYRKFGQDKLSSLLNIGGISEQNKIIERAVARVIERALNPKPFQQIMDEVFETVQ